MARGSTNPSVMRADFSTVPPPEVPRSSHDRSHRHVTTFNSGFLIPIFADEMIPADVATVRMTGMVRLATPVEPIMDNLYVRTFFFAIPYRLVWDNWQKFNGEQVNPGDSVDFLTPQVNAPASTGFEALSPYDYLGLPTGIEGLSVNAFHLRAMNLVFNEWFRDENLQDSMPVLRDDGPDDPTTYKLLRINKQHDYFTSCLPWPQKGPSVGIPFSGYAPVVGLAARDQTYRGVSVQGYETGGTGLETYADYKSMGESAAQDQFYVEEDPNNQGFPFVRTDFSSPAANVTATINDMRQAAIIQQLYETDARGGTRYTETIKAHFGVDTPDARVQRPEYLGGGRSPLGIFAVPQTGSTDATTPQGNLAAYGEASFQGHGFTKSFTEHCLVLGFAAVQADLTYQQGVDKMWSRRTRFDYYLPKMAHLGEQPVLNREIYAQGTSDDDLVFGYQERWAEMRYKRSMVTGKMRSNDPQSLDVWHLAQEFSTLPTLSDLFIQENPPVDRIIAVASEPELKADFYFKYRHARPMPVRSVPGIRRF